MQERSKTISLRFYDDEILYKDPTTGDIHLKEGVKRMNYRTEFDSIKSPHINYEHIYVERYIQRMKDLGLDEDSPIEEI